MVWFFVKDELCGWVTRRCQKGFCSGGTSVLKMRTDRGGLPPTVPAWANSGSNAVGPTMLGPVVVGPAGVARRAKDAFGIPKGVLAWGHTPSSEPLRPPSDPRAPTPATATPPDPGSCQCWL